MANSSYMNALFIQKCRASAKDGKITVTGATDAFWASDPALAMAIQQQKPEKWPAIQRVLRWDTILDMEPLLKLNGIRIVDDDDIDIHNEILEHIRIHGGIGYEDLVPMVTKELKGPVEIDQLRKMCEDAYAEFALSNGLEADEVAEEVGNW